MKKIKTLIISIVVLCVTSTLFATVTFADSTVISFSDISSCSTGVITAINWASDEGIVVGYEDGTFAPDATITRQQMVIMLWRLCGKPEPSSLNSASKFPDTVSLSGGSQKAIAWAVEYGLIQGYSDGYFRPTYPVTRQQVIIMLWRLAEKPEYTITASALSDIDNLSTGSKRAIYWAEENNILMDAIENYTELDPTSPCLRQYTAAFLYRYTHGPDLKAQTLKAIFNVSTPSTLDECLNNLVAASEATVEVNGGHAITKEQAAFLMCDIIGEGCYPEIQFACFGTAGDAIIAYLQACADYGYYSGAVYGNAPFGHQNQSNVVSTFENGEWKTVYKYVYYAITNFIRVRECDGMVAENYYSNGTPLGSQSIYREDMIYVSDPDAIYSCEKGGTGWYVIAAAPIRSDGMGFEAHVTF